MKLQKFESKMRDVREHPSDISGENFIFRPVYNIIDGKKYITKQYTNKNIVSKKELVLDNDLYAIGVSAFYECTNLIGELNIPDSVEYIVEYVFNGCSGFTSLKLSKNLKEIKEYSFSLCTGFTGELVIPDSVDYIYYAAFLVCSGFTSLKLSNKLKEIGDYAFKDCTGLTGVLVIPESVEYMGECVFEGCNFNKIYIPKIHVNKYDIEWNYGCNAEIIEY